MDRERAKEYMRTSAKEYLTPDGSGKGFICPLCNSGSGPHGTGMTTKDQIHFTCWACNDIKNADIFEIIGKEYGLTDFNDQVKKAAELFHIDLEGPGKTSAQDDFKAPLIHNIDELKSASHKAAEDVKAYLDECHSRATQTDYYSRRGIGQDLIDRFNLGYDPKCQLSNNQGKVYATWRAAIIPTEGASYVIRNLDSNDKQNKVRKEGPSLLFNKAALWTGGPVFIVEGEIDAMSVIAAGGEAVGLGSTSNTKQLIAELRDKPPAGPIIVSLDNDETGQKTAAQLKKDLAALKVRFTEYNISGNHNDPNEALINDRELFLEAVQEAVNVAQAEAAAEEGAELEAYLKTSAAHSLEAFIDGIAKSVSTPEIPTGYPKLDALLDGGLYPGLYCIGAVSSLGKTTFTLQMADQIAMTGQDVLIFSLEMARAELMAKSISRLTFRLGTDPREAKTTRGILNGKRYDNYSFTEHQLIKDALKAYKEYANHIFISEGVGDIGAAQVGEIVERHIKLTGRRPVVIIDYLQILAPYDMRGTDKQNTDKAVLELKRVSRDHQIPVITVSSFSRAYYNQSVTMEAFKESGAIEYSADVLIGIQFKGQDDAAEGKKFKDAILKFDANAARRKDPRELQLKILKNRNGQTGGEVEYTYYALFNDIREK